MKILIATGIYHPQIGGPATYSKLLYDELPRHGFEVEVQSFGDFIDKPKIIRHFLYFWRLLKTAHNADIVYAQDLVSVGLPALLVSQVLNKKFILKIVGDYAWEQGTQRFNVKDHLDEFSKKHEGYSWQVKILKIIEKYVALRADAIITPSEYLKSIISNWGIDESKIKVIYNGFNSKLPKSVKTTLRKRHGFYGKVLISVGRLVPWKGFDSLIKAMRLIKNEIPDATLIIAGEGKELEKLKKIRDEEGLTDSVIFTGKLEQEILFEKVAAADIFILNTNYEGFSHQLLETMALGTPIVTTAVGGNKELISHGNNGLLVSYGDSEAIAESVFSIIRKPTLGFSLSRKAKETVKYFSDERMLNELVDFLMNQKQP